MDNESDMELEEINKLMEQCVQSCLSSEDKYQGNYIYISARIGDVPNVSDFAGTSNGNIIGDVPNVSDFAGPPNGNQPTNQPTNQPIRCLQHMCKSPSSGWFSQITLDERNHYFHYYRYITQKHNKYFSKTNQYYNWGNTYFLHRNSMEYDHCSSLKGWWFTEDQMHSMLFMWWEVTDPSTLIKIPPHWIQWQTWDMWWLRLFQTFKNKKYFWYFEQQNFWNVQSNKTPCCR